MSKPVKYKTDEERKAAHSEAMKKYYQANKEKFAEYHSEYYQNNKEKLTEHMAEYYQANKDKIAEYYSTPFGRAHMLLNGYRREDKKYNRGETIITPEWVVDNIFSQPCHYCGETDWRNLGCDRIDNALPHTPDNVVPCCCDCNKKKARYEYDEYMRMIGKIA